MSAQPGIPPLDPRVTAIYTRALSALTDAGVEFLVGGAYALTSHTGIVRYTKDLDVFVHSDVFDAALSALARSGFRSELTFPHWLGKAHRDDEFIDVIFSSGNAMAPVDDDWFAHARRGLVLGVDVAICPPEEMIWSKAWIMERERYDGADVIHLVRACHETLDWDRLIQRFDAHWRVLLAHLVLFGFVYPSERDHVPGRVMAELTTRLQGEQTSASPSRNLCQGTLLSRQQYLVDVVSWGYEDARLHPHGNMRAEDIAHWTAAIASEASHGTRHGPHRRGR